MTLADSAPNSLQFHLSEQNTCKLKTTTMNKDEGLNETCSRKKRGRSNSLVYSPPVEQALNNCASNLANVRATYELNNLPNGQVAPEYFPAPTTTTNNPPHKKSPPNISSTLNVLKEKMPSIKSQKTFGANPRSYVAPSIFMHRIHSSPALASQAIESDEVFLSDHAAKQSVESLKMIGTAAMNGRRGGIEDTHVKVDTNAEEKTQSTDKDMIKRVHSTPSFSHVGTPGITIIGQRTASMLSSPALSTKNESADMNPHEYLKEIVESFGYSSESLPALSVESYFLEYTDEQIQSYDNRLTNAVRGENIDELLCILKEGKPLQCSNRFGESIVHMACRRGSVKVMRFLLEVADVSGLVRDDFGRTPMHDACWTREPMFDIVKMLIHRWPDMLLVSDKRGHTPLQYVRRDHWSKWCRFLTDNRKMLAPREIVQQKVRY